MEIQGAIRGIMIPDTLNWNRAVWEPQVKTFLLEVVGTILGGKMLKLSGRSWSGAPQPSLEINFIVWLAVVNRLSRRITQVLVGSIDVDSLLVDLLTKIETIYFRAVGG